MADPVVAPAEPVAPAAPVVEPVAPVAPVVEPAAPAAPATLLTDPPAKPADPNAPPAPPATGDWGADWRTKMAAGNEKKLAIISQYTSPQAVVDALVASKQALSGKKTALAADATPEQIAAYRKDNGVPEAAEGYLEKLPDGLVIGEADKPYVGEFAKAMHDLNAPPQHVHAALKAYYGIVAKQAEAVADLNEQARVDGTEALMAEWGAEFKGNKNAVGNLLAGFPEEARNAIMAARDQSGLMLFNNPHVLKAFAQVARDINPAASVVSAAGGDVGKTISGELAQIANIRKATPSVYWAEDAAGKAMRGRELELIAAEQSLPKRSAA